MSNLEAKTTLKEWRGSQKLLEEWRNKRLQVTDTDISHLLAMTEQRGTKLLDGRWKGTPRSVFLRADAPDESEQTDEFVIGYRKLEERYKLRLLPYGILWPQIYRVIIEKPEVEIPA